VLSTCHRLDFHYTRQELEALFRYANEYDVDEGGHYDARSAAINVWSHYWVYLATKVESETIGTFYFHWESPALWESETDECFALDDVMADLGRWELQALGRVKHGDVPSCDVRRGSAD
jgi:hypothetical protein